MNEPRLPVYEFHKFRLDTAKRLVYGETGEMLPLSPKVFDTLLYLVENRRKVVEKDELMKAIWHDTIVEENNLNKNISVLRRALGEKPGEHRFIVTVPGHGYRFIPDVRIVENVESHEAAESDILPPEKTSESPPAQTRRRKRKSYVAPALTGILAVALVLAMFLQWRNSLNPVSEHEIKTVAVLPFMSLVAENRNEALELGMADTLISKLGESREITVRPFNSVRRYATLEQDALAAGRELGTDAVLAGTIQNAGERIRISTRLFRVSDGRQLWTAQFDEKLNDIFAVQDSISQRVATALKIRLEGSEKKRETANLEAYQNYMKGRYHVYKVQRAEVETGISYFAKAIELDPGYALAYVGLADAYRAMALAGEMPANDFLPKAKAAANKALELDAQSAEAHSVLGSIMFWYDWDWQGAENQYRLALELDPNSSDTRQFYAHLLSNTGRNAEALEQIKRARELDPLNLRVNALEAMFRLHAGKTDEAIEKARKTLEMDSNFWLANTVLCWAYTEKGMFAEAIDVTRRQRAISPLHSEPIASGAYALARSGRVEEARRGLDELLKSSGERYVPPYNIALVYCGLGERQKALDYLEKAASVKDLRIVFIKVDRRWDVLRSEPRFVELMKRMNFE
jgi:serine/threonine-protein kinase